MAKSDMSGWIMPLGLLAGAYALYEYFKTQCEAIPTPTGFVGTVCNSFFGTPTVTIPVSTPTPSLTTLMPSPSAPVTTAPATSVYDPWAAAIAALKVAAGGNSENYDQWAWYWQNSAPIPGGPAGYGVPGSLSANVIGNLITAGGGGNAANLWAGRATDITAEQFVSDLKQAEGLSGYTPSSGIGIPAYLINGGY